MDKNNKSIFIIIISIALVIISGTFAWLSWRSQNTAMVLTIGDIRGLTVSLKPYQINATLSPVASYTSSTNVVVVDVTADNKKTEEDNFKLFYKIDTIDDALKSEGFKYTIAKCTSNCSNANNYTVLNNAGGDFSTATSNSNLNIYQETVPANTTYNYKVYLWIDSNAGNQSNMQNKTFTGELRAKISETLYTMMRDNAIIDNIKSNFVTNNNGIQFNDISSDTNGKGIYIRSGTENDPYPIYYYRGAVNNNNVLFAGFCWKIVRTTSTGGTKLIYNGLPSGTNNDQCTNTTGTATQLAATSNFNSNSTSPADVGYMYGTRYAYSSATGTGRYYAPDVTYSNGTYTLVSNGSYNVETKSDISGTNLNYQHYTCGSTTATTCTSVRYVYYVSSSTVYYITLTNGKKVEDALDEMLTSSTNTTDSRIKTAIDTWYSSNMASYTSKLEDTPYCNDRTIYRLGGWDPNGGDTTKYLYLGAYGRTQSPYTPSLTCSINDAFTLPGNTQGNGKLIYPVGLLTADEIMLAGGKSGNSTYYLYTNQNWWSGSPFYFYYNGAYEFSVYLAGDLSLFKVNSARGVRPAVSLKPGTKFSSGDGSYTDPYVVE